MSESATARASSARPEAINTVTRRVRRTGNPAPTAGIRRAVWRYPCQIRATSWRLKSFTSPVLRGRWKALAIPHALAAQHAAALDRRAGLVLDRELAQALVAVQLVTDLGLGGDAGCLVYRRTDRGRLEDV